MNAALIDRLCELSAFVAPSGAEGELLSHIQEIVTPFCDRIERDALGNLLCYRDGTSPSRSPFLLSAHTDEVGFMVTEVCADGSLAFACIGGMDESILCGKSVTLRNARGQVRGTIFEKPLHLTPRTERKVLPKLEELRIDIGCATKEEALAVLDIGDVGVMDGEFRLFGRSLCCGKALDDRLGCAILCEVLKTLSERDIRTSYPLCVAFTVREEVGLSGALVAANRVRPYAALVLETTAIADLPSVPKEKQVAQVGGGGVLSIIDRSTVYDRALLQLLLSLGEANSIPVQTKKYVSGGNDAGHIHKSTVGVRCAALSAPCRYLHSPSCVLDTEDASAMLDLVLAALQSEELNAFMEVSYAESI